MPRSSGRSLLRLPVFGRRRCARPWNPFGVTREGLPITDLPVPQTVQTGILITAPLAGLVSELDEREAARFGHYTWTEWQKIPHQIRVRGIAHHMMQTLIEAHVQDASEQATKARNLVRNGGR